MVGPLGRVGQRLLLRGGLLAPNQKIVRLNLGRRIALPYLFLVNDFIEDEGGVSRLLLCDVDGKRSKACLRFPGKELALEGYIVKIPLQQWVSIRGRRL